MPIYGGMGTNIRALFVPSGRGRAGKFVKRMAA
jgi:hypothetical protein